MNTSILSSEYKLTDRYQTTIPEMLRKALHLHKRDKLRYSIQSNGDVLISRAEMQESDPVLAEFLNLFMLGLMMREQKEPMTVRMMLTMCFRKY